MPSPICRYLLRLVNGSARQTSPEIWRRYLTLILDGLRPQGDGVTPLHVPALDPEEFEKTMRQNVPRHH
ncbi:MAG TPA: hypothetical protein VIY52_27650 [Streptosporangiaceae bacterium]